MRFSRKTKPILAHTTFDVRWLFPIVVIVIAGLLAFSAEIKERLARAVASTAVVGHSH